MAMATRALPSGALIHDRYRVNAVLGEGGFGVTYRVTDERDGRIAAMKEYMPADIAVRRFGSRQVVPMRGQEEVYERFRTKFLEEAQTIYRFQGHPGIIEVQHLFYENNTAYYVMEFLSGTDLRGMMQSRGMRLSWEEMRPVLSQVADALTMVHKSGIVHCDISPDNIFILNNGQAKLIDFGAAKNVLRAKSTLLQFKRGYAPPEQIIRQGKLGPWTDVYALAVTIYRCYTGKMPPPAEERIAKDEMLLPTQMGLAVPSAGWEQALRRGMAVRYTDRYQSVMEFWHALSQQPAVQERIVSRAMSAAQLECIGGCFAGRRLIVGHETLLGTDKARCGISFPAGTPGVSGVHMRLWPDGTRLMAMDMGSRYGSLINNIPMTRGLAYEVQRGDVLVLGGGQAFRAL